MNRFLYFAGFAFIALSGAVVMRKVVSGGPTIQPVPQPGIAPAPTSTAGQWFAAMKPYCNAVEVEVRSRYTPPPSTSEGSAYAAACFALAGKIDRAREIMERITPSERGAAANVLFEVAHPVADAGDDRASGPMMELVLEHWPNNYMALYHAGMSEYSLGQTALAGKHLRDFLQMYTAADGFHENAERALQAIDRGQVGMSNRRAEKEPPARP